MVSRVSEGYPKAGIDKDFSRLSALDDLVSPVHVVLDIAGDVDAGKIILRDYINATIGFEELSSLTNRPSKSLMHMFGPNGNPHARNLFDVISRIQQHQGVHLEVKAIR